MTVDDVAPFAAALPSATWIRVPNAAHGGTPKDWLLKAIAAWLADEGPPAAVIARPGTGPT